MNTTYKSIITLYDSNGKQLLRNFMSSTRVIDVSISNDNKYLAFAEMDTSGTVIKSTIQPFLYTIHILTNCLPKAKL